MSDGDRSPTIQITRSLVVRSILVGITAAALAGGVSLLLPKIYRAEARILPSLGSGSALQNLAGVGGGLSSVLEIATQRQENPIQTFPEIILGRIVLDRTLRLPYPPADSSSTVLAKLDVKGKSPRELQYRGVRKLREVVQVSSNPRTSIIAVAVETRDSTFSAYLANSLISELDRFNVETRRSQGRAVREFVASRMSEAQTELNGAEASLAAFRKANMRIGNSPQLSLEEERFKRAVMLRAETYQLLAHQYEMARIEEYRDTPTFSVIEAAVAPYRKSKPLVLLNCAIAFALAAAAALFSEAGASTWARLLRPNRH